MEIEGNHWTVRWYRHYVKLGGFGRDPENLWRFLRVVTIWAPMRWLFVPQSPGGTPPIFIIGACLLLCSMVLFGVGLAAVEVRDTAEKKPGLNLAPGESLCVTWTIKKDEMVSETWPPRKDGQCHIEDLERQRKLKKT